MTFFALPPVRRAAPLRRGSSACRTSMERYFAGRPIRLYASGTAALARALLECAARSSSSAPEAVLPAYGCPDLVAACLHAAVFPRLVDLAPGVWSYDPDGLDASLSKSTVAVVAVNLLGAGDGAASLWRRLRDRQIPLIQDSAQCLPRSAGAWPGDHVVLSFGRGKPMNLLYGGALIRGSDSQERPPAIPDHYAWRDRVLTTRAAAVAFNMLTEPLPYRLLSALPGTGLGQVAYQRLRNAAPLPERAWEQVGAAFEMYCREPSYSRARWQPALEEWLPLGIEPLHCPDSAPHPESLRLALLAPDRAARDTLVARLNRHGLGASRFYGSSLDLVSGIPEAVRRQGPFPSAHALADRLFTLPTHRLVSDRVVGRARTVVREWQKSACE